jgi:hypothetical protein
MLNGRKLLLLSQSRKKRAIALPGCWENTGSNRPQDTPTTAASPIHGDGSDTVLAGQ